MSRLVRSTWLGVLSALWLVLSTSAVAAHTTSPTPSPPHPPSIILIIADDLGWGEITPTPTPEVPAPNLRRLQREGVTFTRAYAAAPMCGPSRAAILTGQYPQRHGFEFNPEHAPGVTVDYNQLGLDPSTRTLAEALRLRGYRTALIGKWHLGPAIPFQPTRHGFDEFFGIRGGFIDYRPTPGLDRELWRNEQRTTTDDYLTDALTDEACAFIDRNAPDPFFLCLAYTAIHRPLQPRPTDDRFAELPLRQRRFARMIAAMDDGIGRVLATLDRHAIADNTIVCFISDNGAETNGGVHVNAHLRMGKRYLFEGGLRVPMIVRWPGVAREGAVCDEVASTLDLAPTVIRAAHGTTLWISLDGLDLRPLLEHAGVINTAENDAHDLNAAGEPDASDATTANPAAIDPDARPLFWRMGDASAVRAGRWKLIRSGPSRWLFDLHSDDAESNDLHAQHPDIVAHLDRLYATWERRMQPPRWPAPRSVVTPIDGQDYQVGN